MDLQLQFLESFPATGSDGQQYKVCAYDRLAPDPSLGGGREQWSPTGQVEYRLEDGRLVDAQRDGTLRIASSDVTLTPARVTH